MLTKLKLLITLMLFLTQGVSAGTGSGKVTFLLVNHNTTPIWAVFNVENTTAHACSSPNTSLGKFKFTVDSTRGREMAALLMSAEARQEPITVKGSGTCIEQNREGVDYIFVGDPAM